jgi:YD repeat-containing protein
MFLLAGCGKHNDHPGNPGNGGGQPDPSVRIKSTNNTTYTYDGQGRLARATYTNSLTARTDYTYFRDSVVATDFNLQGNPHGGGVTFYLSDDGLMRNARYTIDSTIPPLILKLTYNADRQFVEQTVTEEGKDPDLRTIRYYSKGNIDSAKTFTIPGNVVAEVERFDYYTDRHNYLSNEHNGISFTGVSSVNLVKKEVQEYPGSNVGTRVLVYTYEFDEKGRPVMRHTTLDGVPQPDLSYTWY